MCTEIHFTIRSRKLATLCVLCRPRVNMTGFLLTSSDANGEGWHCHEKIDLPGGRDLGVWFARCLLYAARCTPRVSHYIYSQSGSIDESVENCEIEIIRRQGDTVSYAWEKWANGNVTMGSIDSENWKRCAGGDALVKLLEEKRREPVRRWLTSNCATSFAKELMSGEAALAFSWSDTMRIHPIADKTCCLIGEFASGTKTSMREYIVRWGGTCPEHATKKANMYIVGERKASLPTWFGEDNAAHADRQKLEEALVQQDAGKNILIVREWDVFRSSARYA